jgi:hypothetical protein
MVGLRAYLSQNLPRNCSTSSIFSRFSKTSGVAWIVVSPSIGGLHREDLSAPSSARSIPIRQMRPSGTISDPKRTKAGATPAARIDFKNPRRFTVTSFAASTALPFKDAAVVDAVTKFVGHRFSSPSHGLRSTTYPLSGTCPAWSTVGVPSRGTTASGWLLRNDGLLDLVSSFGLGTVALYPVCRSSFYPPKDCVVAQKLTV